MMSPRVSPTYNLAELYPEIAAQWHPTKNRDLTPEQVTPYSGKKVWWVCQEKHEWPAIIGHRTRNKSGCPYCSGRYATKDNNLAALHPEIACEWHPIKNGTLKPNQVRPGSNRTIWWKCKLNPKHEWPAKINNRVYSQTGCPYCSGKLPSDEYNLEVLYPEIAAEWHPTKNGELKPSDCTPGSGKRVFWLCKYGHTWSSTIDNRVRGNNCPKCNPSTSKIEIRIFTELKTIFNRVERRKRVDGIEIDVFLEDYYIGVEVDGKYWHADSLEKDRLKNRKLREKGISIIRVRHKELPEIIGMNIIFSTNENRKKITEKILLKIINHFQISETENIRAKEYLKKRYYQNDVEYKKIVSRLPGPSYEESLLVKYPALSSEWDYEKNSPFTPDMFSPGSHQKVWWRCKNNSEHIWPAEIKSRVIGNKCPLCSGYYPSKDYNFEVLYPELAKEWHPTKNGDLSPKDVTPGSEKKVWWKCSHGHSWPSTVYNRTKNRSGCPICYKYGIQKPAEGQTKLKEF